MEPEFQEEQFEQAAKSVPPDEKLSSKDPKEERDGAQGDPRKRVLGCESKTCRLWVRSEAGTGETSSECGGARAENQSPAKAGKACIGRREELVGFHASLTREAHSKMLIGGVT